MRVPSLRSRVKIAPGVYVLEPVNSGSARNRWRRLKRKRAAVDYLGSKCAVCTEDVHIAMFIFHHKEPELKTPHPNRSTIFSSSAGLQRELSETDLAELDTCELLCSNCHAVKNFGKEGNLEYTIDGRHGE